MDKEQLQQNIEEIDYLTDSISKTIEYLEWCLIEILKQKEWLNHKLSILNKKKTPLWFKQSKDET